MSIIGKIYKTTMCRFPVWFPNSLEIFQLDKYTKFIYLGCLTIHSMSTSKILVNGIILYTHLDPIINPKYFEEL